MAWLVKDDSFDAVLETIEYFMQKPWSDGLPIVPPTESRIQTMIEAAGLPPAQVLASIPPLNNPLTVQDLAAHAVMAGCIPSYMPVLLAIVNAITSPAFNLLGVQATTHNCAPLAVVGGSIKNKIGMNSGHNVFGSGNRANATIGRALRLVLLNIGGGLPEKGDKSTFGHPGKYTFCIAEDEGVLPWEPLHSEIGTASSSGVTVFACEAPHSVVVHGLDGKTILDSVASTMSTLGNNNTMFGGQMMVIFGKEHIHTLHEEGWSRRDVQSYLYENARVAMTDIDRVGERFDNPRSWPVWVMEKYKTDAEYRVPVVRYREDILLTSSGGQGAFSMILPGWGYMGGYACSAAIVE
ncbi:hypothetical protein LLE49_12545 [Alicyclobacillus tolerans]|uniref:hypothetical protein n=1 Tax=Alicyclobacillus tolerans TaxID=90970 RepID=UPI001F1730F9|nr:hypothetical protein [Alicyclobacillus tolerans]MCF8565546.1 hypothetical protein [Alicyclobacillus tolerans]